MKNILRKELFVFTFIVFVTSSASAMTCTNLTKSLSKGSENSEVLSLQQFLFDGGYLTAKPNGYFGASTVTAVKKFQISNGMSPVGSVGTGTRGKIKEVSCGSENSSITKNIATVTSTTKNTKNPLSIFTIVIYKGPGVSDKEIAIAKNAVQSYYSLTPKVLQLDEKVVPKTDDIYTTSRAQYKAGSLWKSISKTVDPDTQVALMNNKDRRYIVLLSDDMNWDDGRDEYKFLYTNALIPSAPIIISLAHLKQASTTDIFSDRLTKLIVRTLGIGFGLVYSNPDADNKNCIFYQTTTVEELDKIGKDLCKNATGFLNKN